MENLVGMFKNVYRGKKVLVTGNTGFKGSWLTTWLIELGAEVIGISDEIPTTPSMFNELDLESKISHYYEDITKRDAIYSILQKEIPDYIFHLAAQPIVSVSYEDPLTTINTNVLGSAVLLQCIKELNISPNVIMVTSDKCYYNVEWEWGYKETDHLGGKDIYSASKGAAEIVINAYYNSFFKGNNSARISTGRAGNVIGGGDWAKDRIVVDCFKSWNESKGVEIRSPRSTRPWQHVLEPLSGYLHLGASLNENASLNGESFNFGPRNEQNRTVLNLIQDLEKFFRSDSDFESYNVTGTVPFHEAGLLKLNCDKALFHLKWEATLNYDECVEMVGKWYNTYYNDEVDLYEFTRNQIEHYTQLAINRNLQWTKE